VETPNIEGRSFQRYGANWVCVLPPEHLSYFEVGSLQIALQRARFQAIFHRYEAGTGLSVQLDQAGLKGLRLRLLAAYSRYYPCLQPLKELYLTLMRRWAPLDDAIVMYACATQQSPARGSMEPVLDTPG
jgi:hypothetical protein